MDTKKKTWTRRYTEEKREYGEKTFSRRLRRLTQIIYGVINMKEFLYKELSYEIIGLAMEVHRELGTGFLEKVYENALMILFEEKNLKSRQQEPIKINFRNKIIGDYIADIIVEDKIILELKCTSKIIEIHKAQIANYLKATGKKVGIIINFGNKSLEIERVVMQNL